MTKKVILTRLTPFNLPEELIKFALSHFTRYYGKLGLISSHLRYKDSRSPTGGQLNRDKVTIITPSHVFLQIQ